MDNLVFTPLSDEDIEGLGLSVSDLWMLQGKDCEVQGPFSTNYLGCEPFFKSLAGLRIPFGMLGTRLEIAIAQLT